MDQHYGIFRAKVLANGHKAKDGWVYVKLLNTIFVKDPFWAAPAFPNGQFFVPAVGNHVFVFFEEGYLNSPIYFGQFYLQKDMPDEIKATYPSRRLIKTKKGHKIEFEESNQKEMLRLTSAPKNGKSHTITLDTDKEEIQILHSSGKSSIIMGLNGKVKILTDALDVESKDVNWKSDKVDWKAGDSMSFEDKNGNKLIKSKDGISIKDKDGNRVDMTHQGIKIVDKFGGQIEMKSGKITITSKGQLVLASGTKGVVRTGDKARPHTHKFILTSPTGPVQGQILPESVQFDVGSQRVKAG